MDALKTTLQKFKKVIIAVLVIVALMFAYKIFVLDPSKAENAGSLRSESDSIVSSEIGREIVGTLNRLKTINIDNDFFQEDAFVQLIDFSVEIQDQPIGRDNPFKQPNIAEAGSIQEVEGAGVLNDVTENQNTDEPNGSSN